MLSAITQMPIAQAPGAALLKQAKDLEGVFINTLTSQMFSSVKSDGPFGGGFGEQTWRGMQSEQIADQMAKAGGLGLASQIAQNLLDAQQAAQSPAFAPKGAYK